MHCTISLVFLLSTKSWTQVHLEGASSYGGSIYLQNQLSSGGFVNLLVMA